MRLGRTPYNSTLVENPQLLSIISPIPFHVNSRPRGNVAQDCVFEVRFQLISATQRSVIRSTLQANRRTIAQQRLCQALVFRPALGFFTSVWFLRIRAGMPVVY